MAALLLLFVLPYLSSKVRVECFNCVFDLGVGCRWVPVTWDVEFGVVVLIVVGFVQPEVFKPDVFSEPQDGVVKVWFGDWLF